MESDGVRVVSAEISEGACFAANPPMSGCCTEATGSAGSRTSAVAVCMMKMGACVAEESCVNGELLSTCKGALKEKKKH